MPQSSTSQVFMSYSRRDNDVMRRVVSFLRKEGIKVWVDNEKLIPGTPIWEEEIEKAIRNAPAIIVVLSPDSKNSEWVRREIGLADQYRRRVFPLLVRGDEETSISLRLINRQFVDIRENEEGGLNKLEEALSQYLQELSVQEHRAKLDAQKLVREKAKLEAVEKAKVDLAAKEEAQLLAAQKIKDENSRTGELRREKDELAAHFKIEQDKFLKEKNELEERLQDERRAREKIESNRLAADKIKVEELTASNTANIDNKLNSPKGSFLKTISKLLSTAKYQEKFFRIWRIAVLSPSKKNYELLSGNPKASAKTALWWSFASGAVGGLFGIFHPADFSVFEWILFFERFTSSGFTTFLGTALFSGIFALLGLIAQTVVIDGFAQILGKTENKRKKLIYLLAAINIPTTLAIAIVSGDLLSYPYKFNLFLIILCVLYYLYSTFLGILATRALYKLNWPQTILAGLSFRSILAILISWFIFYLKSIPF